MAKPQLTLQMIGSTFIVKMGKLSPKERKKESSDQSRRKPNILSTFLPLHHISQTEKRASFQIHHFPSVCLFKQQLSKNTAGFDTKGDVICLILQCKTESSNSSGQSLESFQPYLFLRSFNKNLMQSESYLTILMEEYQLENFCPFQKIRNMQKMS